jgi:hypothetical protein
VAFKDLQAEILEEFAGVANTEQRTYTAVTRKLTRKQKARRLRQVTYQQPKEAREVFEVKQLRRKRSKLVAPLLAPAPDIEWTCCTRCRAQYGGARALRSHWYRSHSTGL